MSIEPLREDPIFRPCDPIIIPHNKVVPSRDSIVGSYQGVVVLLELGANVGEVLFGEFCTNVVTVLVFVLGAESVVQVGFQIVHGKEGLEQGHTADGKGAVIDQVHGLAKTKQRQDENEDFVHLSIALDGFELSGTVMKEKKDFRRNFFCLGSILIYYICIEMFFFILFRIIIIALSKGLIKTFQ